MLLPSYVRKLQINEIIDQGQDLDHLDQFPEVTILSLRYHLILVKLNLTAFIIIIYIL